MQQTITTYFLLCFQKKCKSPTQLFWFDEVMKIVKTLCTREIQGCHSQMVE